jgi:hypothetical protein
VAIALGACRAASSSRVEHVSGPLAQRAPVVGRLRRGGRPASAATPARLVLMRHLRPAVLAASWAVALAHHQRSVPG